MSLVSEKLHEIYHGAIGTFIRAYPHFTSSMAFQIDHYCRANALYLWHKTDISLNSCVEGINTIYCTEQSRVVFSEKQVAESLRRLSVEQYKADVPDFFSVIVAYDKKEQTNYSRLLLSLLKLTNIDFAFLDLSIDEKEAGIIAELSKKLAETCDANHILPFDDPVDPFNFITPRGNDELIITADKSDASKKTSLSNRKNIIENNITQSKKRTEHSGKPSALDELNGMIGLNAAKREISEIVNFASVQNMRKQRGLPTSEVSYHLVFTGNPGTGKTTVARLVAKLYKELGIVSKGHLIEASAKDLIAGYVGQTAIKTGEVIKSAIGGVLFIDEAYTLVDKNGQGFGQEAIDTLLKEMEDNRGDLAVIVAGYDDLMKSFIESNPGLKSRFNRYIHFEDYTADEMTQIFSMLCKKNAYRLSDEAASLIQKYFERLCAVPHDGFANGRTARNLFESIISKQASRIAQSRNGTEAMLSTIEAEDVRSCIGGEETELTLEEAVRELNDLVGLNTVKEEIYDLIYIVQNQQRRKSKGFRVPSISLHMVFLGNPGTGKTTVARCVAKIYKALGLLSKGHLIETDRSGLVAGYVGQTAIKTQKIAESALGGILFVDEAYSLVNGSPNDFGREAIDTLLKFMEDNRDDLVVIVAGYDEPMEQFIHSNPGLESRFNRYIHFEDYTAEQMVEIFETLVDKNQYTLTADAKENLSNYFDSVEVAGIGNGRGARNLFEKVITEQAKRIGKASSFSDEELNEITAADITRAIAKGRL